MGAVPFCIACLGALVGAQQPAPAGDPPPEIIVTGERINRSLRETPSSVVVMTEDAIEQQGGVDRVDELLAMIPNVQMTSGGLGPTIRGQDSTGVLRDLPAFLGGSRPRVTLQIDGRAAGYFEFIFGTAPLWDVRQVEVFRSPQSTTQGRNSIAGAIFVRTNDPEYDWQGRGRAIHGSRDLWQGSAMVTGPIIDDQLAFRIAADLRRGRPSSDIIDNAVGADTDEDRFGLVRVKLLAEPAALPWLKLVTSYVHSESLSPQIEGVRSPFRERRDPLATYGVYETKADSLTAELGAAINPKLKLSTTVSTGNARFERFAPAGLGQHRTRDRDHSIETRLDWQASETIKARGGIYHSRSRLQQRIDVSAIRLGIGIFDDRQSSRGLFGELEARPVPRLTVTAGVRHQSDRQDRTGVLGLPATATPVEFDQRFSALLPKVSLAYELVDGVTIGLLVQRAFNPGGATLDTGTGLLDTFDAETLWNYEAFVRSSLWGGKVTVAGNIFYNDIQDAQRPLSTIVTLPSGLEIIATQIDNAPASKSYGLELEAGWRATERLTLRSALGLLRTRIDKTVLPTDSVLGKEFQRSPRFTASAAIDWRPTDRLRLSSQLRHHSGYFSNDLNTSALRIGKATKIDGRISYERGALKVFGYARNLLNDFSMTFLFSPTFGTAADARELGVGIEARF